MTREGSATANDAREDLETRARRHYEMLQDAMTGWLEEARRRTFDGRDVLSAIETMIAEPRLLSALFGETFRPRRPAGFLPRASVNVAIYALRLGRSLGYESERLVDVGAAGMLHKVGFATLAPALIQSPERLGRRDLATIQQHPKLARDLLRGLGGRLAEIGEIVYQSCERSDGSGYPQKLHEGRIAEPALAVGLVSVFEALTQARPYRPRLVPFGAVKQLLEQERDRFPRVLLREFVTAFSIFPPFTYVRLSSRALARVVDTDPSHPLRPTVMVIVDADGHRPVTPQTIDLRSEPFLNITGPVDEKELPTESG